MKIETTAATLLMCALITLSSCTKKPHTPTEDPQPVGFTAMSQVAVTKATTPLSQHHQDFGVWGVAVHSLNPQYMLWDDNTLTQVSRQGQTDTYVPTIPAYWFAGYTYNFMALAPFNSGATDFEIHSTAHTMSFDFNIGNKYSSNLEYDLMGAVAETTVGTTKPSTQNLVFWHLSAKIKIEVTFVDAGGTAVTTGTVSQMRLSNVDSEATYTLSFDDDDELAVSCESNPDVISSLTFTSSPATFNILPQNVTDFELYLDFTLDGASYNDFKVNLNAAGNPSEYKYNERYNWNITIGPKAAIGFTVSVNPWSDQQVGDDITII